ncbi:MAG: Stp1/IreP family PP2C-type Ser/Thr phosphatase [Oscillospiraceae bacterium]|nr:Stp1/IreP family PP2C-type Ser/Thr phosphatase [Oscillospiraceae bacterium]
MQCVGLTDRGRSRGSNQDAFEAAALSDTAGFAVVCDGMGGAKGGQVASRMAVKLLAARLREGWREDITLASLRNILESALAAANVEIREKAAADSRLEGMGTTVVAAVICGNEALVAHMGDSRAYRVSKKGCEPLTRDHSIVQDLVESGQLTAEQAQTHPRRHFITRALGADEEAQGDFDEYTLAPGDRLLLCTDGLTNMLDLSVLHALAWSAPVNEVPKKLIDAANEAGGADNITAVVLTI